ncbi:MAG: 2Fe-2S iron-sulfur cluster-binding protein [Nocardioides sp.]|nr:2Fe-2S iron-sulfur cluster-binding protein [Nocardioides sp.]
MSQHALRVAEVVPLTDDAVAVGLAVPDRLRATFAHEAGQHLPVRVPPALLAPGAPEERRTYSICTAPSALPLEGPATVRIGVRRHPHGVLSRHLVDDLHVGDELEVGAPTGRFTWRPHPAAAAEADGPPHLVCVAAGSGITPMLAIAAEALTTDPRARVTLVRVDRTAGSVMFADEVADLKDAHPDRCVVVHVLTREHQSSALLSGRWDDDRVGQLLDGVLTGAPAVTGWYLCGPHPLVEGLRSALRARGVDPALVHRELFAGADPTTVAEPSPVAVPGMDLGVDLEVVLGGRRTAVPVGAGDANLLDALLKVRRDAPYACRGGVCGTCRGRVVEGTVAMADQWALEPEEVAAGYALACRSRATSSRVVLDLDA